jgi:Fur family transcriptional regulator, zinc uptake regulator
MAARDPSAFTVLEMRILKCLSSVEQPLGAYAIARTITLSLGRRCHPNSVYRCLAQLIEAGAVRRIVCKNSYVLTSQFGVTDCLLICASCDAIEKFDAVDLHSQLKRLAATADFGAFCTIIEVIGTCQACQLSTMFE